MEALSKKNFFNTHPAGLKTIFFTEMWERFGYYGMRALLVLYMTKEFLFNDNKAYAIYGNFTAFVYITPILGGIIADKFLGFRKCTQLGAIFMAIGYLGLAIPKNWFYDNHYLFFTALALVAVGNGFFKPNTSSLVGLLYEKEPQKRDAGYTIFYMGINLGSIIAPILCGYVAIKWGWSYGFIITSLGLIAGLCIFNSGKKTLIQYDISNNHQPSSLNFFGLSTCQFIVLAACLITPIIATLLTTHITGYFLNILSIITLIYISYATKNLAQHDRRKIIALLLLMFFYASFFAFFEQAGSSINLFTDRSVNRIISLHLFDFHKSWVIPTTFFQAINPMLIIILAPLSATLWMFLNKKNLEPQTPYKFAIGLFLASIGFFVLVLSQYFSNNLGKVSMIWLIISYFFMTAGELAISPAGMACVSRLSPRHLLGLMMGALLLSIAFGNYIAAMLATLSNVSNKQSTLHNLNTLQIYSHAFKHIGLLALSFTGALFIISPIINKLMKGESIIIKIKETLIKT